MRHRRTFVLGAVVALVLLGFAGTAQADSGSGKNRAEVVRIQDRCDPATFNAALQDPNACVGDGDTTFDDFFAEFLAEGSVGHWRFHPDDLTIRAGRVGEGRQPGRGGALVHRGRPLRAGLRPAAEPARRGPAAHL